jgi:hypothetical protein
MPRLSLRDLFLQPVCRGDIMVTLTPITATLMLLWFGTCISLSFLRSYGFLFSFIGLGIVLLIVVVRGRLAD